MIAKGHGDKISRKQEHLIVHLLAEPTVSMAAKKAGINESTARKWMKDPGFSQAYREARQAMLQEAVHCLQQAMLGAVATLRSLMYSADASLFLKAQCARDILLLGIKTWEVYEQTQRLERIEKMVESYAQHQDQVR